MQNYHTLLIIQINLNILNHFRGRWPFSSCDKKGIGALASLSKHQLSFCCRSMFMGYLSHRFPLSNICVLSDKFTYSSVSSPLLDFLWNIANEDGKVNEDVSNPLPNGVFLQRGAKRWQKQRSFKFNTKLFGKTISFLTYSSEIVRYFQGNSNNYTLHSTMSNGQNGNRSNCKTNCWIDGEKHCRALHGWFHTNNLGRIIIAEVLLNYLSVKLLISMQHFIRLKIMLQTWLTFLQIRINCEMNRFTDINAGLTHLRATLINSVLYLLKKIR